MIHVRTVLQHTFYTVLIAILTVLVGQVYIVMQAPEAQAEMPCGHVESGIDGFQDSYSFDGCPDNANWSGPKKNENPINYNGSSFTQVSHANGAVSGDLNGVTYDYFYEETRTGGEICHDYILIKGDPEKARDALVVPTFSDLGCHRYGAERGSLQFGPGSTKVILLNEGLAKDGRGKVRSVYEARRNNLTQQTQGVCQGVDPLNMAVCGQRIKTAFFACYAELTHGEVSDPETFLGRHPGEVIEPPTEAALFRCMSDKTGYPISAFNGIFSNPSKAHKVVCVLANIGWFFCPVTKFFAAINMGLMKFLTPLLNYDVLAKDTPRQKSLEAAWSEMRNIANIIFAIVFIFVIYSQVTGVGISNYGIKKLLPNLIVSAILINLSFWICTILIDISNILGSTIFELLSTSRYTAQFSDVSESAIANKSGWALGGIATVAIVGGTVIAGSIFALMGFLFPMLVTACLTLIMTMIILVGRQAAITILVVLSPIAFACMLLPGTKSWFDRWKGLFSSMLFLYPLVALVFGGSILASSVIAPAGSPILLAIFGLGVASIPIVVVPKVVQSAGGVFGFGTYVEGKTKAIGGKVAARGQSYLDRRAKLQAAKRYNPNSTFSKMTTPKTGDGRLKRFGRRAYGSAFGGSLHRQMLSSQADKDYESGLGQAASNYSNARLRKDDRYRNKVAGANSALGARLQAGAEQQYADYEDEVVEANMLELASVSTSGLEDIMDHQENHSDEEIAAAFREYASRVGLGEETDDDGNITAKGAAHYADELLASHQGESPHVVLRSVATAVNEHAGAVMVAKDIDDMRSGNFIPINERITANLNAGAVSQMDMANASEKLLGHAASIAEPQGMANLKTTAKQLKANKDIYPLAKAVNKIDDLAS